VQPVEHLQPFVRLDAVERRRPAFVDLDAAERPVDVAAVRTLGQRRPGRADGADEREACIRGGQVDGDFVPAQVVLRYRGSLSRR